jgi:hypothetical protein
MQVDEQGMAAEPVRQPVRGVHGQGGLADPGHPADRLDSHHSASPRDTGRSSGDLGHFLVPAGEHRRVRRQRIPHPQSRRPRCRNPGDLGQGVEHLQFQAVSGREVTDDQAGVA